MSLVPSVRLSLSQHKERNLKVNTLLIEEQMQSYHIATLVPVTFESEIRHSWSSTIRPCLRCMMITQLIILFQWAQRKRESNLISSLTQRSTPQPLVPLSIPSQTLVCHRHNRYQTLQTIAMREFTCRWKWRWLSSDTPVAMRNQLTSESRLRPPIP